MQDNAAQQWWYSTILAANTISNTGKFAKIVHPDFFGEDVGRSSHHSDLENQWRLWWRYCMALSVWQIIQSCDQYGKSSTLLYAIPYTQRIIITSIAFCQPLSMHRLQSTFTKVKKENPQLGSNPDQSATVCQSYWYAYRLTDWPQRLLIFMNLPLITSSLMNPLVHLSNHSPKKF